MKKELFTVWTFAKINTRRFFRDKLALFFSIGFPLIFLFVFGGLYSNEGMGSFKVAVIDQSKTAFATQFVETMNKASLIKVNPDIKTLTAAQDKMSRSELDATIILPSDFGTVKPGQDSRVVKPSWFIHRTINNQPVRLASVIGCPVQRGQFKIGHQRDAIFCKINSAERT